MTNIATLPAFSVEFQGALLSQTELLSVEEVVISQKLSAPAMCEISFLHPERAPAECGQSMRLCVGAQQEEVFAGDVTALEHEYEAGGWKIRVRAYDRLARLRKRFSVKAHVQVGLRDLAKEMVSDLGILVTGSVDTPLWQHLIQ